MAGQTAVSYSRWAVDCSVYTYLSDNGLACCACCLNTEGDGTVFLRSTAEMITHLHAHLDDGHLVPDDVFAGLLRDAVANDHYLTTGDDSLI
jgi:hypothetical protein